MQTGVLGMRRRSRWEEVNASRYTTSMQDLEEDDTNVSKDTSSNQGLEEEDTIVSRYTTITQALPSSRRTCRTPATASPRGPGIRDHTIVVARGKITDRVTRYGGSISRMTMNPVILSL